MQSVIVMLCSLLGTVLCHFITRDEWGARPPKHIEPLALPVPYVVIHHTYIPDTCNSTSKCCKSMRSIQNFHQDTRKWDDIGYNFAIGDDGNVYEGRGWNHVGAHAYRWNRKSIGIVLIGDFTNKNPSEEMQQNAQDLIALGVSQNVIAEDYILYGHRQVGSTECPGNTFYQTLKTWPHWQPK